MNDNLHQDFGMQLDILIELNKLINDSKDIKVKPSLLMIITGTDIAYTLESGVKVVPIGCLKN